MNPSDRYINWQEIGHGAFGSVHKAYDQELNLHVAIKLLKQEHTQNAQLIEGLYQEVKISRGLRHDHICPIHDLYNGPMGIGIVMDLIDGVVLSDWRDAHRDHLLHTAPQRLDLLCKLCEALEFAHTRIVHRDMKPDNVFLREGDPRRPVIMDFGASFIGRVNQDGTVAGTPKYMSPEQWEAPDRVDARSDLFSLGIMAYELFTGQLPPTSLKTILKTHTPPKPALHEIPLPSLFCAAIPAALDRLILQMMAYHQADRPQSAREVLDALRLIRLLSSDTTGRGPAKALRDATKVRIKGGEFYLGTPGGKAGPFAKPIRKVELSPFCIATDPVTVREYRRFVDSTGYHRPPLLDDPAFGQPEHPVVGVAFADALAYALWIGGNLPTEAQWECAAKAGAQFRLYPWGDEEPSATMANIGNVSSSTSPVRGCPAGRNPWGLYDLCGNVWEWCLDGWAPDYYQKLEKGALDPVNTAQSGERVLRGGGFDSFAIQGRCSFRHHAPEQQVGRSIGFRLVFPVD
ncbi:MAG: SUMF1/EgtB/PvdO family nonheme iron enzyme [Magnetococcales bacterium]|nr:SUMF1/EgtB/PvdO family nonheme iron enzyme [Magnetococcales bacterium]